MNAQGVVARDSQKNLVRALESGQLSAALAKQGQDILARMETPLRLGVLGLPGSGKSTLLNLLVGDNVLPEGLRLPTISMVYGDEASAKCTMPDGHVEVLSSDDLYAVANLKPAFVELALPLAALRKLSMMEVVAGSDPVDQKRAITWAAKRTDIALWCTQDVSPFEEQLWSVLPDRVQDHSFLVLTKADELGEQGRLGALVKDANTVGMDYFRKILPIATSVALSARKADGTVDKALLKSSGGVALISAILREVDAGQNAAADAADVFLRQIDFDPTAGAAEPEKPTVVESEPVVEDPPVAKPEPIDASADKADVAEEPTPEPKVETTSEPEVEAAPQVPQPSETVEEPLTDEARALCQQVVDQLAAEGTALAHQLNEGTLETSAVIDVSVDTVIWLADYLSDNEVADEPAMARTCATANDAADLVQLIQLEKGDTVALDALSLMIQLKHEIQAELAA